MVEIISKLITDLMTTATIQANLNNDFVTRHEFSDFKSDYYDFKDEMYSFRDEMYEFKSEMYKFKGEMYIFRDKTYERFDKLLVYLDKRFREQKQEIYEHMEERFNKQDEKLREYMDVRFSELRNSLDDDHNRHVGAIYEKFHGDLKMTLEYVDLKLESHTKKDN